MEALAQSAAARPTLIAVALVYLLTVAVVGWWSWRRTQTAKDFFIAGQALGLMVTGLATMSAAFSGFLFLGGPGLTYRLGLSSLFIVFPVSLTGVLLCWTVAKRLRLFSEVREVFTVPDAIYMRYRSRAAAGWAAVAIVIGTVGYLGAQLLALAVLLDSVLGLEAHFGSSSLAVAMAVGLAVMLAYAVAGGMVAGVYTDVFQGALMLVAAVAVFYYALQSGGGLAEITRSISTSEAFGSAFLDPLGGGRAPLFLGLSFFFVFTIGVLGQPHTLHKFLMLKDPRKLRFLPAVLGVSQVLVVLIWLGIGLAVPALVAQGHLPPFDQPDRVTPVFLLTQVPDLLAGLVFAGVLAAIMSTADSFVNIASAALVRDLPRALGKPLDRELYWGRWAVVMIACSSAVFAFLYGDLIALLGTFAYGIFAAALTPCLAVGLHWKRAGANAAVASLVTGLVVALVVELWMKQTLFPDWPRPALTPGVLPSVVAMACSFSVFLAVAWLFPRTEPLEPEVDAVMSM